NLLPALAIQQTNRNTRSNLYNFLLNFINYSVLKGSSVYTDLENDAKNSNIFDDVCKEKLQIQSRVIKALLGYDKNLLEMLFRDATSNDPYLSSLSSLIATELLNPSWHLTHLNQLRQVNISAGKKWLALVLDRSRVSFLLKQMEELGTNLSKALQSSKQSVFVYQFDCLMNALMACASYTDGAMELITNDCMTYLINLECLKTKIFWTAQETTSDRDESKAKCQKYLQVLIPCFRLILALFSSCFRHRRLHHQVLQFLMTVCCYLSTVFVHFFSFMLIAMAYICAMINIYQIQYDDVIDQIVAMLSQDILMMRATKLWLGVWYQLCNGPIVGSLATRLSSSTMDDGESKKDPKLTYFKKKNDALLSLFQFYSSKLVQASNSADLDTMLDFH
ncbi:hypothetical protein RFI_03369, partial [Reticulomyxa filosa]